MSRVLRAHGMSKCIGCYTCMITCALINQKNHSLEKSSIHIKTTGGLEGSLVVTVCHGCKEAACAEACPTGALKSLKKGGVDLVEAECIGCRRCVSSCTVGAITFNEDTHKPIICHHCGICVRSCPHGCLSLEEVEV